MTLRGCFRGDLSGTTIMNKNTKVHCCFILAQLHKIISTDTTFDFNNVFENVEVNIIHPQILSSFTHPQVVPNLYGKTKEDILKNVGNQTVAGSH